MLGCSSLGSRRQQSTLQSTAPPHPARPLPLCLSRPSGAGRSKRHNAGSRLAHLLRGEGPGGWGDEEESDSSYEDDSRGRGGGGRASRGGGRSSREGYSYGGEYPYDGQEGLVEEMEEGQEEGMEGEGQEELEYEAPEADFAIADVALERVSVGDGMGGWTVGRANGLGLRDSGL